MAAKYIKLEPGRVYRNRNGKDYRCITPGYLPYREGEARMQNINTGWTFRAHGVQMYEDGTIEWDYSTGGYFDDAIPKRLGPERRYLHGK